MAPRLWPLGLSLPTPGSSTESGGEAGGFRRGLQQFGSRVPEKHGRQIGAVALEVASLWCSLQYWRAFGLFLYGSVKIPMAWDSTLCEGAMLQDSRDSGLGLTGGRLGQRTGGFVLWHSFYGLECSAYGLVRVLTCLLRDMT